eukprot:1148859-Pelagomonas_calceolata.AAC.7
MGQKRPHQICSNPQPSSGAASRFPTKSKSRIVLHVHNEKERHSSCNLDSGSAKIFAHTRIQSFAAQATNAMNIVKTVTGLVTHSSVIDNSSVNVIPLPDGKMFTSTETIASLYKIDPSNLATLEQGYGAKAEMQMLMREFLARHPQLACNPLTAILSSPCVHLASQLSWSLHSDAAPLPPQTLLLTHMRMWL